MIKTDLPAQQSAPKGDNLEDPIFTKHAIFLYLSETFRISMLTAMCRFDLCILREAVETDLLSVAGWSLAGSSEPAARGGQATEGKLQGKAPRFGRHDPPCFRRSVLLHDQLPHIMAAQAVTSLSALTQLSIYLASSAQCKTTSGESSGTSIAD